MNAERIIELYEQYKNAHQQRWIFGNMILYKMCEDYPTHEDPEVRIGKIWLIGRSYAAAIERRKGARDTNDDFYYTDVSQAMESIHSELDRKLKMLKESDRTISDETELSVILATHNLLTRTFSSITSLEKRSLASKYLHFHCPDKFFIYDTRACETVRKLINKGKRKSRVTASVVPDYWKYGNILEGKILDLEYGEFVCRMLALQECLQLVEDDEAALTPRKLDDFLLWCYDNKSLLDGTANTI